MSDDNIEKLEIDPENVEVLITKPPPELELIDVREEWELTRGVLPGSSHVPLSRFADFTDKWYTDRQYVVYCEHGIRSLDVVMWLLQNKGIHARSMRGGFAQWQGQIVAPKPRENSET